MNKERLVFGNISFAVQHSYSLLGMDTRAFCSTHGYVCVPNADAGLLQLLHDLGGHQVQLELHGILHDLNCTYTCTSTLYSILCSFFFPMSALEHFFWKVEEHKMILFQM